MRAANAIWAAVGATAVLLASCLDGRCHTALARCRTPGRRHGGATAVAIDELSDFGVDLFAPAPAGEDAVVARADRVVVELARVRNARAQRMSSTGLSSAGDVVELAFDRQQRAA